MSKISKVQKIVLAFIILTFALLIKSSAVQAVYFNGYADLKASRTYYCIEHQDGFTGGEWAPYSYTTIKSDDSSQSRRALAYILYQGVRSGNGGYNYYSNYQIAVWKWYYQAGINTRYPSGFSDGGLFDKAMNIESVPYSNESASIKASSSKITMTGVTGSVKLKQLTGTVSKIEVEWVDPLDDNKTYTQTISEGKSGVNNWIRIYSDKDCTKELNINDISTKTFYIKNLQENYKMSSIRIYTEAKASGYSVTVTRWRKTSNISSQQDIISATVEEGQDTEASKKFTIKYSYGKLKIDKYGVYKEDGKDQREELNASFKIYCKSLEKWVAGEANGYKTYVDNIEEATTYESGTTISKLFSTYEYELAEVAIENNYYNNPINLVAASSNLQSTLSVSVKDSYQAVVGVIIYDGKTNQVEVDDGRTSGDMTIQKVDYSYNNVKLPGAKMKIYLENEGWLVRNSDGTYSYNGTESNATEFVTDENGEVKITCIKIGTYHVYETEAPEGYDITKQDGYRNQNGADPYGFSINDNWAYLGNAAVGTEDNSITFTGSNKKIVSLDGYVWVDQPDTKGNVTDNVYTNNSNDELKAGIPVSLYDASGNLLATTTTDANGYYLFTSKNAPSYTEADKNIYYWDLVNSFVEFIYNNKTTYNEDGTVNEIGYVVVDPFAGTNASVNAKAQEYEMKVEELDDNNLTGMTGNYRGRAVTCGAVRSFTTSEVLENTKTLSEKIKNNTVTYDDLKEAPLTGYYDNKTYRVSNINLGLIEQNDPGYNIDETLAYIKVKMKGYTYTYKYGDAAATTSTNVPTVNEQNSAKTFTGKIYPTDIAYNMAEATQELQVYVVYSIDVKNTETTYVDNMYVEERLYLDSLINTFDTARYELCTNENNEDKSDFALWQDNGDGTASYDVNNANSVYKDGMGKQETKTSYIQFKIKEEALEKILTGGLTYEDIESAPTIATATGYHEYLRTDNLWKHDDNIRAFNGSKGTASYPTSNSSGKKYYVHKSISKSFSSADLYLKLSLGEARTLSGTVFEDTRTEESAAENTNLGNGILDDNEENRARQVTVELLNADRTTVTKLYQERDGHIVYNEDGTLPDARTTTEVGGTFTFEGVVPGYYYIRFTYGDGTQTMMPAEDAINANDYRSTIINTADNDSIIKNAMEASTEAIENAQQTLVSDYSNEEAKKLLEWYKYLDRSYSTAVDDTDQRLAIENYVYNEDGSVYDEAGNRVEDYPTNVNSYTPMAGISIENDINDYTDNGNYHTPNYDEFNFGIIKEADTNILLKKKITKVSFLTQTGSTLVSANPTDRTASYLSALDDVTGGSKYAKLEMEPSLIYGSELETTYELTIENNTAKDYIEEEGSNEFGYYYKYGEKTSTAQLKKITVKEVVDELDEKYNYDSTMGEVVETITHENGSVEQSTVTIEKPETTETQTSTSTETTTNPDGTTTTTTNNYLSIKGWSGIESQAQTSITYTATSLLSTEDEDTAYVNEARITSLSLDKLTTLNTNFEWGDNLRDSTTLTITPNTGSDRSNTYWIAGAIALVVLGAGFVFLKKKVLK